ncbi:MAG: hypothetical protein RL885_24815 [Planctomycetota bacterium]
MTTSKNETPENANDGQNPSRAKDESFDLQGDARKMAQALGIRIPRFRMVKAWKPAKNIAHAIQLRFGGEAK